MFHFCPVLSLACVTVERCLPERIGQVGDWKWAKSGSNYRVQTGCFSCSAVLVIF